MTTLLEMTAEIVMAHASNNQMTSEELLQELQKVHATLQALETGTTIPSPDKELGSPEAGPKLTVRQAFKRDEVICMICGKGGMKTLTRHLSSVHDMKPGAYRKEFGIPRTQSLTAKSYSESRKKMAEERGLGDVLAKAREKRMQSLKGKKTDKAKQTKK